VQRSIQVAQAPPAPSCGAPDGLAVNISVDQYIWPPQEPFERGVSLACQNGNVTPQNFRDSFGYYYSGFTPSNDPCGTSLNPNVSGTLLGGLHSHPYFRTPQEYMAGVTCGNVPNQQTPTISELNQLNQTNQAFGPDDGVWPASTGTPLFMRVPVGNVVKKKSPGGNVTQVYP
jgi:hypothetical protein